MTEAARFFTVAVAGLALDITLAWSTARLLHMPLWLAAATGFVAAAATNYAAHELWTFRQGARQLSASRALRYSAALAATLSARVATVIALSALVGEAHALSVLLVSAGVSFLVNYLISKHFVFRPASIPKETTP